MKALISKALIASAIAALTGSAVAAPVFADNFESYPASANASQTLFGQSGGLWEGYGFGSTYVMNEATFGQPATPDGSQYAFISGAGYFSHTMGLADHEYEVSFLTFLNSATFSVSPSDPVSNFSLLSSTADGTGWYKNVYRFTPTAGYAHLTFSTTLAAGYVDDISVSAVPEPETYAMFLAGLGAVGFLARRRSAR